MCEDWEYDYVEEDRLKKEHRAKMNKQMKCMHERIVRKSKPNECTFGYDYIVECPKCEKISWINAFVGDYISELQGKL